MQRLVPPGELPEDTSCEALFDDCTEAHNELHRRRGYSPFQLLIGRSPPGLPLDGDKQLGEVSASLTSDGRHRLHIQRECYRAYLDEEMSLPTETTRDAQVKTLSCMVVWKVVLVLAFESTSASTNQVQSTVQRGCFLGSSASTFASKNVSEREMTSNTKLWCGSWMETSWYVCSSTHLRPMSTAEQTLCSLRDGEARTFQQVVQELPKRNFVDLVGQPSPVEEDLEEPMNVASSDDELREDFLSGEEFASAPDDSEVPKDPQMTYQTRSASSQAEAPAAMSPEPTEAPIIPKVIHSTSFCETKSVRLRKSVYGLIDAPRAWWERVETDMNKWIWRTLTIEPCFWVMTSVTGRIEGLAVAYVDDFMVAIHEESLVG